MAAYPITIIVRHPRENPKKCSIVPLQGRADVQILTYPLGAPPSFDGYIRLAAQGPALSDADRAAGLLLLDGSWRSASKMNAQFDAVPPRSLAGWHTAYPRVSKLGTDPANGLASIEALYIACRILGRPTAGLLDHYRWADRFLEINESQLSVVSCQLSDKDEAMPEQIDRDFALLAGLCADSDPADEERLSQALAEAHEQAKQQVRRQMGLK